MLEWDFKRFPKAIFDQVNGRKFVSDTVGESDSSVFVFEDAVLKIEKTGENANHEYEALCWLDGKLPVPKIIAFAQESGFNYLLMTKLNGAMACDTASLIHIDDTVAALADGLKKLWGVGTDDCPLDSSLDKRLVQAKANIETGLVDVNDFEPDTIGPNGFSDVHALYAFLVNNRPPEDPVFTHGDYCLPNLFIEKDQTVGFLDLGKAGIADRWQDIALCVRSLQHNMCAVCGMPYTDFVKAKNALYAHLGVEENAEKLRYYILLDELF